MADPWAKPFNPILTNTYLKTADGLDYVQGRYEVASLSQDSWSNVKVIIKIKSTSQPEIEESFSYQVSILNIFVIFNYIGFQTSKFKLSTWL